MLKTKLRSAKNALVKCFRFEPRNAHTRNTSYQRHVFAQPLKFTLLEGPRQIEHANTVGACRLPAALHFTCNSCPAALMSFQILFILIVTYMLLQHVWDVCILAAVLDLTLCSCLLPQHHLLESPNQLLLIESQSPQRLSHAIPSYTYCAVKYAS